MKQTFEYSYVELQPLKLFHHGEACIIRVKSYANGALFALSNIKNEDPSIRQKVNELSERYISLFNQVHQIQPSKIKFYTLMQDLQKYIAELAALTHFTTSELEMAESVWVWQNYTWNEINTPEDLDINDSSVYIKQVDTPVYYPLTDAQKAEWIKILDSEKPAWFSCLPIWLKHYLTELVTKQNWDALNRFIPTALRSIPGLANTTQHELQIYNKKDNQLLQKTICHRYGVPVPYDVVSDSDRMRMTEENIEQFLNYWLLDDKLKNQFSQFWGIEGDEFLAQIKIPVLMVNLLTSLPQGNYKSWLLDGLRLSGSENNTLMTDFIHAAIAKWVEQYQVEHPDISAFDFAVNSCRSNNPVNLSLYFLEQLKDMILLLKSMNLDESRKRKLNCLERLSEHLEQHSQLDRVKGRNKNLFSAALLDLSTRLLGGLSAGNCKSSKDRKGLELLTADAILIYFEVYKEFPAYDDTDEKRSNFLRICQQLYMNGHHIMIAHHNAPGSLGLKDEGIMDSDLKQLLGDAYVVSKQNADLNNPYTFIEKYWSTIRNITIALAVVGAVVASALILGHVLAPLAISFLYVSSLHLSIMAIFSLSLASAAAVLGAVQCYNHWKKGASASELIDSETSNEENTKQSCNLSFNCL